MKKELKTFQRVLTSESLESQREDEEVLEAKEEAQRRSGLEAFLKLTLHFLRRMNQEELADGLQSSKRISLKNVLDKQEVLIYFFLYLYFEWTYFLFFSFRISCSSLFPAET